MTIVDVVTFCQLEDEFGQFQVDRITLWKVLSQVNRRVHGLHLFDDG
jgi:hypothetical protein